MEKRLEQTQILYELLNENNGYRDIAYDETVLYCIVLYCGRVPDALQPKAYCTNPGL